MRKFLSPAEFQRHRAEADEEEKRTIQEAVFEGIKESGVAKSSRGEGGDTLIREEEVHHKIPIQYKKICSKIQSNKRGILSVTCGTK